MDGSGCPARFLILKKQDEMNMEQNNLTKQEAHFAFGKNWASYAHNVTNAEIEEAEKALSRLLGGARLDGKRFLDIGRDSGFFGSGCDEFIYKREACRCVA